MWLLQKLKDYTLEFYIMQISKMAIRQGPYYLTSILSL